jgi:hypothetical protein
LLMQQARNDRDIEALLESMSAAEAKEYIATVVAELERRKRERMIDFFVPNPFQKEFFEAGQEFRYRFLSGGTQSGKSICAGIEFAYHMRGEYPKWWKGRKFSTPITALVVGIDREQLRGAAQRILLGEDEESFGTGAIPKDWLGEWYFDKDYNNCIDYITIPYVSGGVSYAFFVTQNQKHTKFQGRPIHLVWGDESITQLSMLTQFLSRITSTDGAIMLTACPEEMGYTEVYEYFDPANPSRPPQAWYREASLTEVTHLSKARIQEIIDSYPPHVRPYKVHGKPVFGKGMVYPFHEETLKVEPFMIKENWRRIAGIDFGYQTSLTVIIWIAIDPSTNIHYIYDVHSMKQATPEQIVPFIKIRDREAGFDIPVSFPKDGNNPERSTGNVIADMYAELGVNMLEKPAVMTGRDGKQTTSVEASVEKVAQLMHSGKFKVFYEKFTTHDGVDMPDRKMEPIFQELRTYVRDEDGKIKKTRHRDPHHLDAIRYAIMMDNYAISASELAEATANMSADTSWNPYGAYN